MKHYVNQETSEVFAYDDEQVERGIVPKSLIPCPARPEGKYQWNNGGWEEIPKTQEEIKEDARNQIQQLEDQYKAPKWIREFVLSSCELEAQRLSETYGVPYADILAGDAFYQQVRSVDKQIFQLQKIVDGA